MGLLENTILLKKKNIRSILLLPSLLGLLFFMLPISYQGVVTIPVALLVYGAETLLHEMLPAIIAFVLLFSSLASLIAKMVWPGFAGRNNIMNCLLNPSPVDFIARQAGAVLIISIYLNLGPAMICEQTTGGIFLNDILPVIFLSFIIAGFFSHCCSILDCPSSSACCLAESCALSSGFPGYLL
jgi:nucleoside recognition membrane protein YjiH